MERMNLCSQAIQEFLENQQMDSFCRQDRAFFKWLADTLTSAQKFMLPDGGRLMDSADPIKNAELLRLPYPVTALEYRVQEGAGRPMQADETISAKRIALCISPSAACLDAFREVSNLPACDDDAGFFVMPIFTASRDTWFPQPCLWFVSSEPTVVAATESILYDYIKAAGEKNIPKQAALLEPYFMPFDAGGKAYLETNDRNGPKAMMRDLMVDAMDEIAAAKQFCMILHCKNVQTETVVAPASINKKRRSKGKVELFDYHVLALNQRGEGSGAATGITEAGRATPRQHLRRGHIRRLENRVIWVNAAIVGNQGFVSKDYRISGGRGNGE